MKWVDESYVGLLNVIVIVISKVERKLSVIKVFREIQAEHYLDDF